MLCGMACNSDARSGLAGADGAGGLNGAPTQYTRPDNSTCLATAEAPPAASALIKLTRVYSQISLNYPLFAAQPPGHSDRWFVAERSGRVVSFAFDGSSNGATEMLDIEDKVGINGEGGLLGMAFHPDFASNRTLYLSYTEGEDANNVNAPLESIISRWQATSGSLVINEASEKVLLSQDQPFRNHNGGWIGFGPDRLLYIAFGDGGSSNDPQGNGQKRSTLLGKILRINVDGGDPYAIPPSNPFAAGGGRGEIYALGFRNPWRLSFDRNTGELWAGDVGQNRVEEIDIVRLGGNYGWNITEGTLCFEPMNNCNKSNLVEPVAEYGREQGESITGGYVYRGQAIPGLVGAYLYGDFESGRIWALQQDAGTGEYRSTLLLQISPMTLASFAEDAAGELYVLTFPGAMHRIDAKDEVEVVNTFPQRLSETGCFDPQNPTQPLPALIPYGVQAPLWSDDAGKERWLALPNDSTVEVGDDGDWVLPVGSVVVKQFRRSDRLLETRLMMRHDDGDWRGYTYAWNSEQTEATLLGAAQRVVDGGSSWLIPSPSQCMQCHTTAAGRTLGLETAQLNGQLIYPDGGAGHQLEVLARIGVLADAGLADAKQRAGLPAYAPPEAEDQPLELRARSYLHSNCSNCHRPEAVARVDMDLRATTPLAKMGICNVSPDHGDLDVDGAMLLKPGDPEKSLLWLRTRRLDANRMPPLASERVDEAGTALIDAWIRSLPECP